MTACWCKSQMLAHLNGLVLCFEEAVFKDFSCLPQFSLQCSFHLLPPGFLRSLRYAPLKSLIAILPLVSPLRILRCTDSLVTAAKAVFYPDSIQEFLFVCEEEFQQTVSLIHFISCLDYKYCLPLISEISRIPDAQP